MNKVVYNKSEKMWKMIKKNETNVVETKWIDPCPLGRVTYWITDIDLRLFLLILFNLAYFTYKLYIKSDRGASGREMDAAVSWEI